MSMCIFSSTVITDLQCQWYQIDIQFISLFNFSVNNPFLIITTNYINNECIVNWTLYNIPYQNLNTEQYKSTSVLLSFNNHQDPIVKSIKVFIKLYWV